MNNKQDEKVRIYLSGILTDPDISKYMNELKKRRYEVFVHSVNVGYLITEIFLTTQEMDLNAVNNEDIDDIIKGALLHDVGKLKIGEELLNKTESLDDDEAEEMKKHTIYGYEIIKNNKNLSDLTKEIVLSHHEKLNGAGYPQHKKGKEISSAVQLVSICDMYDAITENRPYRPQKNTFTAFKILNNEQIDDNIFLLLASCLNK